MFWQGGLSWGLQMGQGSGHFENETNADDLRSGKPATVEHTVCAVHAQPSHAQRYVN